MRPEPPRRDRRLDQYGAGYFRLTFTTLDERDRHFGDAAPAARGDEQHLDEERIAVGEKAIERERREGRSPPASVPARAVARVQTSDRADVQVCESAEQEPAPRPVDDRTTGNVTGSEHDVGVSGCGEKRRQMLWIM